MKTHHNIIFYHECMYIYSILQGGQDEDTDQLQNRDDGDHDDGDHEVCTVPKVKCL